MEEYAEDIIENLNHWVTGWVDWNMVLDDVGGPNWAGFSCDSPIIVNITSDEFYKQPVLTIYSIKNLPQLHGNWKNILYFRCITQSDIFQNTFLKIRLGLT